MILTLTLNPAVDKTLELDKLTKGSVNRSRKVTWYAGGKGINVTRMLGQYGISVCAMGFIGGYTGEYILQETEKTGAAVDFIRTKGSTRVNTNVLGDGGEVTEILEPGPVISDEECNLLYERYMKNLDKCDIVVISGSAPQGVDTDYVRKLIRAANSKAKRVILDMSGEYLRAAIDEGVYMIKPNISELCSAYKTEFNSYRDIADFVRDKAEVAVVSLGAEGFLHVDRERTVFAGAPRVEVKSTVSCGDTLVAVYAAGYEQGMNIKDMIKQGAAASGANASLYSSGYIPMEYAVELQKNIELTDIE